MIKCFKYEIEDGISEDVAKACSIAYSLPITQKETPSNLNIAKSRIAIGANPSQRDLFYYESILASVGWNKNDDIFDKNELFNARNTAVDKPVNFMHNGTDIIGHITSSYAISRDNNLITDESEIPDDFDIYVGSVIYKFWENESRQKFIDDLLNEIAENKWCVSMECIFPTFDYALISPDGKQFVIERNNETSFLTKHLRIFGGTGEYENHKIGRFLRNYTFSGKGVVENPANPRSQITDIINFRDKATLFNGTVASINEIPKENKMTVELKYTEAEYSKVTSELASYKAQAEEVAKKEKASLAKEIEDVKKNLESAKAASALEIEAQKEIVAQKDKAIASLNEEVKTLKTDLAKANEELTKNRLEAVKANRLSKLLEKGIAKEKAESLSSKFLALSEEVFAEIVDAIPVAEAAKKEDEEDSTKCEKKEDDEMKSKCDELKTSASTNNDSGLAGKEGDLANDLRSKASSWISDTLFGKKESK